MGFMCVEREAKRVNTSYQPFARYKENASQESTHIALTQCTKMKLCREILVSFNRMCMNRQKLRTSEREKSRRSQEGEFLHRTLQSILISCTSIRRCPAEEVDAEF